MIPACHLHYAPLSSWRRLFFTHTFLLVLLRYVRLTFVIIPRRWILSTLVQIVEAFDHGVRFAVTLAARIAARTTFGVGVFAASGVSTTTLLATASKVATLVAT